MYFLSRKFWFHFQNEPKTAIDRLKKEGGTVSYALVKFVVFWRVVLSEYWLNHCIIRASGLAFALLLTLIPLMATLSFMVAPFVELHPKQVEEIVTLFLPFAPPTVLDHISNFFENARTLQGIGLAVLFVVAIGLFGSIEESLNAIWKVFNSRSLFNRLITFTMVMVYSPLLFAASFFVRRSGWLDFAADYFFVFDVLPLLLIFLAFTMFIWLMPNTKVQFKSAFLGGLVAGVLFELERLGFGAYIRLSIQTRTIYGAYGILPFFLVSLFIVSLFMLFGAQVAYVHQNFRPLLRAKQRWDRRATDYKTYISIRIMVDVVKAFTKKWAPPTLAMLEKRYELTTPQASGMVNSLVHLGFLHRVDGKDAYVPACDLSKTKVKEVIDRIEDEGRKIPSTPEDFTKEYVANLMENVKRCTHPSIEKITFEKMIGELDEGEELEGKAVDSKAISLKDRSRKQAVSS